MILAIDTSTSSLGVAIFDGKKVLVESFSVNENQHTVCLAPTVQKLLKNSVIDQCKLKAITVAIGPGSFTGLRIGLAYAKGIALGLKIPVIGVPTLDILAYSLPVLEFPLCATLHAGRGKFAFTDYDPKNAQWVSRETVQVLPAEELAERFQEKTLVAGEFVSETTLNLKNFPQIICAKSAANMRRSGYLAELGWLRFLSGKYPPPATLTPIYLHTKDPIPG